jgi:hypothetical protein
MGEYAIVWRDSEQPFDLFAGGLSVNDHRIRLRGSAGRSPVAHEFGLEELETVSKSDLREQIAGFPSLRLEFRSGRSLLLTSVMGVGVLFELLETLAALA